VPDVLSAAGDHRGRTRTPRCGVYWVAEKLDRADECEAERR
jgi:hypothetical protein